LEDKSQVLLNVAPEQSDEESEDDQEKDEPIRHRRRHKYPRRDEGRVASCWIYGGAERDRTAGLLVANEALSQLSYSPTTSLSYQWAPFWERSAGIGDLDRDYESGTRRRLDGMPGSVNAHRRTCRTDRSSF
jgi:hypothetical protein